MRPRTSRWSSPARSSRGAGDDASARRGAEGRQSVMSDEDIEASKAPLMDHLIELRSRLIKALLGFGIAFIFCFFFAKQIYNVLVWPFVWIAGAENSKFIYTGAAGIFHHAVEAGVVRRRLHLVPDRGDADLQVRGAGPVQARAQRVSALPGRDPRVLRARLDAGLFHRDADAGAFLARHAADGRRGERRRFSCCRKSANICR